MIVSLDNPEKKSFFNNILRWWFSITQLLCGADRENYRMQCFNSNTGEFQRQIRVEVKDNIRPIYAMEFAPNTNGLFEN